jgi:hypothetical protein
MTGAHPRWAGPPSVPGTCADPVAPLASATTRTEAMATNLMNSSLTCCGTSGNSPFSGTTRAAGRRWQRERPGQRRCTRQPLLATPCGTVSALRRPSGRLLLASSQGRSGFHAGGTCVLARLAENEGRVPRTGTNPRRMRHVLFQGRSLCAVSLSTWSAWAARAGVPKSSARASSRGAGERAPTPFPCCAETMVVR